MAKRCPWMGLRGPLYDSRVDFFAWVGLVVIVVGVPFTLWSAVMAPTWDAEDAKRRAAKRAAAEEQRALAARDSQQRGTVRSMAREEEEASRRELARQQSERTEARARDLLEGESVLVERFLEVASRRASLLDEYGDDNPEAVDDELDRVIGKLRKKYADVAAASAARTSAMGRTRRGSNGTRARGESYVGSETNLDATLRRALRMRFDVFYRKPTLAERADIATIQNLDGEAYEAQVMSWLRDLGIKDVRGTRRSGDQGADILFTTRTGKRVVVQCKRYAAKVGNTAVQEVHAARSIYSCAHAWVVTTAVATAGAREAAQKTRVTLVETATSRATVEQALRALDAATGE